MPLRYLVTGGHGVHHDLDDYAATETPYIPELEIVLNCPDLSVTISRDSFYLDYNFRNLVADLNESLLDMMDQQYRDLSKEVTLANTYILRKRIREYWDNRSEKAKDLSSAEAVFERLITSQVFSINGKKSFYSLVEIKNMLSEGIPLYFSESKTNLRWLGGAFKHDFIVLPESWKIDSGAPHFYETLFSALFDDVVNLDTINGDKEKMKSLIERDIIRKESLQPSCSFIEPRVLSKKESQILKDLARLLNRKDITDIIEKSINVPINKIHPAFFMLKNGGMHISTGMFDEQHNPINDDFISNFVRRKEGAGDEERLNRKNTILLGLCLNNPFIRKLIESEDPHKEYYALTYIAHELTTCQKLLSPYSSFFNMVKARLSSELRRCMIVELTGDQ
jgi:hypothetical protein